MVTAPGEVDVERLAVRVVAFEGRPVVVAVRVVGQHVAVGRRIGGVCEDRYDTGVEAGDRAVGLCPPADDFPSLSWYTIRAV